MGRLPLFRSNGSVNFEWGSKRVSRTTLYPFCICVVRCLSDCPFAATSRTENITQFSRFSCFCSCITDSFLLSIHCAQHMLSAVFCSEAAKRQNTKKRIYSSNNRGSGKVETADSPRNFGQIFPTDRLWKVSGKVESFFHTGKVESLWSGKQKFVEKIVENLTYSKYRFHKLWKTHSTAFYHRFHKPASTAVKCRGHSGHFFCTWIFNRLLKHMWKTCRRRWNSCGIGKKALQNPVFHMFCSVLSQFSMRGFCCGYF